MIKFSKFLITLSKYEKILYFLICSTIFYYILFFFDFEFNKIAFFYLCILIFLFFLNFFKKIYKIFSYSFILFIILQIFFKFENLYFITHEPNSTGKIIINTEMLKGLDKEALIEFDKNGFRSSHIKEKFNNNIYLIGGSTIEQYYLSDEFSIQALLEEKFIKNNFKTNVINSGVAGTRSINHSATISKTKNNKKTKGYIILVGANDWIYFIQNSKKIYFYNLFGSPKEWTLTLFAKNLKNNLKKKIYSKKNNIVFHNTDDFYKKRFDAYKTKKIKSITINKSAEIFFKKQINLIVNQCKNFKKDIFCIFVPHTHSYYEKNFDNLHHSKMLWMTPPDKPWKLNEKQLMIIPKIFKENLERYYKCDNCYYYDLDKYIWNQNHFYDDLHFSKKGAKIFADKIFEFIVKYDLL